MKTKEEYQNELKMEIGSQLNNPNFTGKVYGNPMVEGKDVKCTLITFEPGCINSYHIHHVFFAAQAAAYRSKKMEQ